MTSIIPICAGSITAIELDDRVEGSREPVEVGTRRKATRVLACVKAISVKRVGIEASGD